MRLAVVIIELDDSADLGCCAPRAACALDCHIGGPAHTVRQSFGVTLANERCCLCGRQRHAVNALDQALLALLACLDCKLLAEESWRYAWVYRRGFDDVLTTPRQLGGHLMAARRHWNGSMRCLREIVQQ